MQAVQRPETKVYYLELSETGVKNTIHPHWQEIEDRIQQRKRRALLTIIFLAYPFLLW